MSVNDMVIETTHLTRRYGHHLAVNGVNLNVPSGSIYGFLGPNGAGKTTTLRMLLGLIRPTSGTIRIFGQPMPKARLSILGRVGSFVESPSYYGHLSGYENLAVLASILHVSSSRIDEVLQMVRLTSVAKQAAKGYSLGMKQRLGIAAALLGQPELLILDEPTNGLDPTGIHEMRALIKAMPAEQGVTVLVSSHLLSEIDQMATQVGILHRGKLVFQDSLEALRALAPNRSLEDIFLDFVDREGSL